MFAYVWKSNPLILSSWLSSKVLHKKELNDFTKHYSGDQIKEE
jgi:hypothetical protein